MDVVNFKIISKSIPNCEINVPEELKDCSSSTTIEHIKNYIKEFLNKNYYSINLEILRNGRILRNLHDNIEIQNLDIVYYSEINTVNNLPTICTEILTSAKSELFNGFRIYTYKNGSTYKGNWLDNSKNGKGIMNFSNGDCYNGNWENNFMSGEGKMFYKNGDIYEGKFFENKRDGFGIFIVLRGRTYQGFWKKDKFLYEYVK